jgi:hypothetical protein
MPIFRKKPVCIEARQFDGSWQSARPILDWMGPSSAHWRNGAGDTGTMLIPTLEGDHTALPGDWIIRGVQGEFYPCKPDIFAATYELVS